MKGKKLLVLLVVTVFMVTSAAGCSSGSVETENTPTQVPQTENTQDTTNQDTTNQDTTNQDTNAQATIAPEVNELPETLDNANISIVYWYNPEQYAIDTEKNADVYDPILEAIPDFEAKYGGKVNVIATDWNSMLETVIAQQNAGDAPDLFEVYDRNMYNVILSDIAQPIDEYVSDADYSYYKVDRSLFSWKGQTYAIPIKPYTFYMMFNRDLFALEGLTPPDELFRNGKWNFDEFEKAIKALTKTQNGEVSQYGFGSWSDVYTYFMLVNGGALLNVDTPNGKVSSYLNDAKVQNAMTYFTRWIPSIVFDDDMYNWWDNGKLGIIRGLDFPVDYPFEVGMVPFPTGPDSDGKQLVVFPQGFAVPKGAKNPQGAEVFMRMVNDKQKAVGDQKEANRIGQENYDMIYADDVKLAYAYDKSLDDIDNIIGSIRNYMFDGVPAATIASDMDPQIKASIELIFGPQQ